ncbi:MAG: hypothetical protein NTV06_06440 [candidate division Zixibacteria bacterium]|nr:hypothetical protein [candidate division Zixibacteria bacterium]
MAGHGLEPDNSLVARPAWWLEWDDPDIYCCYSYFGFCLIADTRLEERKNGFDRQISSGEFVADESLRCFRSLAMGFIPCPVRHPTMGRLFRADIYVIHDNFLEKDSFFQGKFFGKVSEFFFGRVGCFVVNQFYSMRQFIKILYLPL